LQVGQLLLHLDQTAEHPVTMLLQHSSSGSSCGPCNTSGSSGRHQHSHRSCSSSLQVGQLLLHPDQVAVHPTTLQLQYSSSSQQAKLPLHVAVAWVLLLLLHLALV
jgi:hypothetical protein